tara:strand:+ start:1698 stop:2114 length:417 start_codon:yes stop_codon:yes gene_type:complete
VSVTKTIQVDSDGKQLHRLRCAFSSAGAGTVIELVGGVHLPAACTLQQVHGYAVSGACVTYQIDVHEAVGSQSSVPADSPMLYQGTSTAKADQSNTAKIGGMVCLDSGQSLYVRLVPNTGSDNAATVDVYIVPTVGGH